MTIYRNFRYKSMTVDVSSPITPDGVDVIKAPSLWDSGYKGQGVVIAVLDTGVNSLHPDLQGRIIGGRNFTSSGSYNPNDWVDRLGHGTHVAGTICASQNNQGVVGVAPQAQVLVVKVLDENYCIDGKCGYGEESWVTSGIEYATDWKGSHGEEVSIISMSLGGSEPNEALHNAIKKAVKKGIIVICASGNDGDGNANTDEMAYPAMYPEVVSVGSFKNDMTPSIFSNSNTEIDIVASGENIISTWLDTAYESLSGTSMATPHVSGATALLINEFQSKFGRKPTEYELYETLTQRASKLIYSQKIQGRGFLDLTAHYHFVDMNLKEKPRNLDLYLAKPDKTIVAKLNTAYNKVRRVKLGKINELNFTVPFDIAFNNKFNLNHEADKLRERYLIKATTGGDDQEWYVINKITDRTDDDGEIKEVEAMSLAYELKDKFLKSYKTRVDGVEGSKSLDVIINEVINETNTIWKLGYVDGDFMTTHRQFDISSKTLLDFIFEVAETFNAIIEWDTINRKINFYKPENRGINRGLKLRYGRYLKSMNREKNSDEMVTRLKVFGKDDLSINTETITGQSYIEDFSFFMYPFNRVNGVLETSKDDFEKGQSTGLIIDENDQLLLAEIKWDKHRLKKWSEL